VLTTIVWLIALGLTAYNRRYARAAVAAAEPDHLRWAPPAATRELVDA